MGGLSGQKGINAKDIVFMLPQLPISRSLWMYLLGTIYTIRLLYTIARPEVYYIVSKAELLLSITVLDFCSWNANWPMKCEAKMAA